jgi:hypothetical protein
MTRAGALPRLARVSRRERSHDGGWRGRPPHRVLGHVARVRTRRTQVEQGRAYTRPVPDHRVPPAVLPPGHRCRVDDLTYTSVGDWFRDHVGHVPVQAAAGLDRYRKAHGCSFAEPFEALSGPGGPMALLDGRRPADDTEPGEGCR